MAWYDEKQPQELVKDRYGKSNATDIKTHLDCEIGIVGFYTAQELVKWYGDCLCETEYYEKDYGDGVVCIRSYLQIHSDKNYHKEIMAERAYNGTK